MNKKITPVVIFVIRNSAGKYLLSLRTEMDPEDIYHNVWQVPGGGLEWGERIEDALKREAREELGITIEVRQFIKLFEEVRGDRWHGIILCYLCTMPDESQPITLNDEASEYGWFSVEEIHNLKSFPETNDVIRAAELITVDA